MKPETRAKVIGYGVLLLAAYCFIFPDAPFIEKICQYATFLYATDACGENIEKKDWRKSVTWFLIALGMVLSLVKNTPASK